MSRIAPNLAKDILDVSPLPSDGLPTTNRQHIRVNLSSRTMRFGTLNLPRPHNNLIETTYNTGAQATYPDQTDPRIDPPFVQEEPWSRGALQGPIGHEYGPAVGCYWANDIPVGTGRRPTHGHVNGRTIILGWKDNILNFAKYVSLNSSEYYMNRSKGEWESGTAIRTYYPWTWNATLFSNSFQNFAAPISSVLNGTSSIRISYKYIDPGSGNDWSNDLNTWQSASARIYRDDLIGVSTISGGSSAAWSSLIADVTPSNTYGGGPAVQGAFLGYLGRYWTRIQRDFYGDLENVLETKTYQVLLDRDAGASYIRRRWMWVDSVGGVKDRRMMTRSKQVSLGTFIVQTWRRQWLDNGAGGAIPIPEGVPPIVHRTGLVFGGDTDTSLPLVPWITGEYPGHPTFNLSAFEAACDSNNQSAIATLMSSSAFPGTYVQLPDKVQYRWHEMRFASASPTWSQAQKRIIGQSHRTDSKDSATKPSGHPKWDAQIIYGEEYPITAWYPDSGYPSPGLYSGEMYLEIPGPGDYPILHRPSAAEDHEINYPQNSAATITQRDLNPTSLELETIRLSTISTEATYHPLANVPAFETTSTYNRLRKRVITQTAANAFAPAAISSDPQWAWNNDQTRLGFPSHLGTGYKTVTATAQLTPGYYGPVGQASDTQIKKAISKWSMYTSDGGWTFSRTDEEQEPSFGYSPGFTIGDSRYFYCPPITQWDRRWAFNPATPGEPNSNYSFFTQQYYDRIQPRIENMFNYSNTKNVEGWNPRLKPTVTPNPVVVDFFQGGPSEKSVTFSSPAGAISLVVASRVQSANLSVKNIRLSQQSSTLWIRIPNGSDLGQWTFTVRAFDGYNYSEPVPVTVRVVPTLS